MENQIEVPYHTINHGYGGGVGGGDLQGFFLPGLDTTANIDPNTLPWCLPSIHPSSAHHHQMSNSNLDQEQEPFCPDLRPFVSPLYGDTYNSRRNFTGLQLSNCAGALSGSSSDFVPGLMGMNRLLRAQGPASSSSLFGTIHAELGKLTAQEIMDAKALAASKSHSEAERRRRERINGHLAKLRSMLPNTTKTDKASLLAEVIQYVKELKRQTSEIVEESPLPTEADELTIDSNCDEEGKLVVTASLCCDDRPDLLPDLISALKTLRLRVLKAEITTVGGRVKNVISITEENSSSEDVDRQSSIASIQEAFKTVMEQSAKQDPFTAGSGGATKRQRTTSLPSIVNLAPFN